jgi:hypothetical protein
VYAFLLSGFLCRCPARLAAQCIVDNPGGSRVNINRPGDADVPAARFTPLGTLNKRLPEWICFTAGYRARLEGHTAGNFQPGNSDGYLLTRFRLGALIKPAGWFKIYTELQDATAFWKSPPVGPPYQSTWDLRRAYADLGDVERSRFAFRVGRQDLNFGYGRLLGTSYWRNASRGYDAAMGILNTEWIRVSAFSASQIVAAANGLTHHQQGNNLHGIYTSVKKLIPGSAVEPYFLWRLSPGFETESGTLSKLDRKIAGFRWDGSVRSFDYDVELAGQTGHIGGDLIRAWGCSVIAGYTFAPSNLKTRVFGKFDFASGDRNPRDGLRGTFDQLYPNIHDHHGLADQVAWQNLKSVRTGARVALVRNWMLAAIYNNFWLASATDAYYNGSGVAVARDPSGLSGTHIGAEYDIQTSYRFDRHLELGAGLAYFHSGKFLVSTNHAHSHTYPYVMFNYDFF